MTSNAAPFGKTQAIIAYLSIFGTIIAYFMNLDEKFKLASFHIRQALGLNLSFYLLVSLIGIFNSWIIYVAFYIFIAIFFFYGLMTAVKGEMKPIPYIGQYFQKWFKKVS